MGLTTRKEEQLKEMPIIRTSVGRSKDGRFVVHRTTITHIKPVQYYDAILKGDAIAAELEEEMLA